MTKGLYLLLDIITIFPVLTLSYDRWVGFVNYWKIALLSILPAGFVFIVWDILFAKADIWSFNEEYLVGVAFLGLPLEEYLFFLVVPLVCLFMLEVLKTHLWRFIGRWKVERLIWPMLVFAASGVLFGMGWYTIINFLLFIVLNVFVFKWSALQRRLMMWTYIFHLLPFAVINGILTSAPVVIYNNHENLGIRIGTIPIEDFFYSYNLIVMTLMVYFPLRAKIARGRAQNH